MRAEPQHCSHAGNGEGDEEALRRETQQLMGSNVGIVRDAERLSAAVTRLEEILAALPPARDRQRAEARNIAESGLAIARSALARTGEPRRPLSQRLSGEETMRNFRKHSVMTRRCGAL